MRKLINLIRVLLIKESKAVGVPVGYFGGDVSLHIASREGLFVQKAEAILFGEFSAVRIGI